VSRPLPPPVPGTAVPTSPIDAPSSPPVESTLPVVAAIGAIAVLTSSLVASKYLLDAVVDLGWPVAVYVLLLATVGYGPSVWWCWYASRRWATGRLGPDIGLSPRWADLGWGPVVWLGALGAQVAAAALVIALGLPIVSNTNAISDVDVDRTYVVSIVITAVIAAPFVEEMVFRGVVMRGLRSRLHLVVVVVLQGVLFGAAHVDPVRGVGNVGLVVVLSSVGIAFGVATALLRRLGPAIVAHALFNGVVLLVVLTGVADRFQDGAWIRPGGSDLEVVEQVGVVDEADVAETHCERNSVVAGPTMLGIEHLHLAEDTSIEHGDVVERGERFGRDRLPSRGEHVLDGR
jgi:membrane protease YdiL (CAAX protease family)